MSKPDWSEAPKGFDWAAMDSSGDWYWYDKKPVSMLVSWVNADGQFEKARWIGAEKPWRETLERRP